MPKSLPALREGKNRIAARHESDMGVGMENGLWEAGEVVSWRRRQLTGAGFALPLAARLARDARWDLHALIELVERGCPPRLAARILAPLDEDPEGL
jgi:hypothetical protein